MLKSHSAVKTRFLRARQELRECLGERGSGFRAHKPFSQDDLSLPSAAVMPPE